MARGAEVFTLEESHGKARITRPRPSNLGSVDAGGERSANHAPDGRFVPGNTAGADRNAKRALTAPHRAARTRLREALEGQPRSVTDELLSAALSVYGSARAELGTSSMFVAGPCIIFATETVLAGYYMQRAAELGFETEPGVALVNLAHSCETQAGRAMTAALAAAKALGGKRKRGKTVLETIEAEASAGEDEP